MNNFLPEFIIMTRLIFHLCSVVAGSLFVLFLHIFQTNTKDVRNQPHADQPQMKNEQRRQFQPHARIFKELITEVTDMEDDARQKVFLIIIYRRKYF